MYTNNIFERNSQLRMLFIEHFQARGADCLPNTVGAISRVVNLAAIFRPRKANY